VRESPQSLFPLSIPGPTDRFQAIHDARPNEAAWPSMVWPPTATRLTGRIVELLPCVPDRDAERLFRTLHHDEVWRHVPGRPRDAQQFAANLTKRQGEGRFVWIVRLLRPYAGLAAGSLAGTTSYLDVSVLDARLEIGATTYAPAVWATKVNPDAKHLLLAYAFETLRVGRVQLKTDVRNVRSQQAIARLGARYEATLRRHQRRDDGTVRDSVLFSILAEEWPQVRESLLARLDAADGDR
jgi:RimJ/RimL family protein N-acetyltransferase